MKNKETTITHVYRATISQRGQITLPAAVRRLLGLETGDRVVFEVDTDGKVQVKGAVLDLADAFGSVPPLDQPTDFKRVSREARQDKADETVSALNEE